MQWYDKYVLPFLVHQVCRHRVIASQRQMVVPLATGNVIEIGAGSGLNLPYYNPEHVSKVTAVEPSRELWAKLDLDVSRLKFPVEYLPACAEEIPLPSGQYHTILSTFTLCTIRNIELAFAEMRRLLFPGGKLVFCDHGLSPEPPVYKWQHRITPLWKSVSGGCHLNRDIPAIITNNGFSLQQINTRYLPGWKPATYIFWGVATLKP